MQTCKAFLAFAALCGLIAVAGSVPTAHAGSGRRTPVVEAVEKVGPAVVNVFTEEAPPAYENPFSGLFGNNSLFDRFFRDMMPPAGSGNRRSLGSGVLISPKGYILTNEHVITKAVSIKVTLGDNREFDARLIGADITTDLAVIKIESPAPLPYVRMGRSDDLMIGETVVAIGNPFGLNHTVTTGIISAVDRTIHAGRDRVYNEFIQVDASINPGNSGGPLLNIEGSLIGINTAIFQEAQGIGFAIPIDKARRIVEDLIEYGTVRRGWVGASVQDMTPNLAQHFGLDRPRGVVVIKVYRGSPADRAGIQQGDVLLAVDGHDLAGKSDYTEKIASYTLDDTFRLAYQRDGRTHQARVRVTSIPSGMAAEFARDWLGIRVKDIDRSAEGRFRLATRQGVVIVTVDPGGPSGKVGIRPGDVVRQINQSDINSEKDFNNAIVEAGKLRSVVLLVQRGRYGYYVTLEP